MIFTTTDKRELFYELKGEANAKQTIVFLNGLSQSTVAWYLMLPLFEAKYHIVLLDFIFQGQSSKDGAYRNFDEHADDVIALMQHLNIGHAIICGISYGSLVAQHIATRFPYAVDKLVLLSTFAHKTEYFKAVELSWKRAIELGGYTMLLDVMLPFVLGENYFENPLIPLDLLKKSRQGVNENSEAILKLMRATAERQDYRMELEKVKSPTLVVHGKYDKLIPMELAEAVHQHIPSSRMMVISHAGHTLNLEAPKETADAILDFLNEEP